MKILHVGLLMAVVLLAGCGSDRDGSSAAPPAPVHYVPYLEAFHVVDSYGNNTEDMADPFLVLDPFIENGEFEVYWYADNRYDYTIALRINDVPSIRGSRLISNEYCGPGLDCDLDGILFCNYFDDFSMSCDPPGTETPNQHLTYFDDLMTNLPQSMYLILDLCDTESDHCEYQVREVSLE